MDRNKILITVYGQAGSGKSTIAFILLNLLRSEGFTVTYSGESDHRTEDDLRTHMMDEMFGDRVNAIKSRASIDLDEIQLRRTV